MKGPSRDLGSLLRSKGQRKAKRNKENSTSLSMMGSRMQHPQQKIVAQPGKVGGRNSALVSAVSSSAASKRQFGTEITNLENSQVPHATLGINKSNGLKNKFFENRPSFKIEEKRAEDEEMAVEGEEEEKFEEWSKV